jgi:hypothetical protein
MSRCLTTLAALSGLTSPNFQFEKLNTSRASVTSLLNSQDAGAILLYHGQTVSLMKVA